MSLSPFSARRSRTLAVGVAAATAASVLLVPTATAAADGSNVVINEVYGGGGNSGSVYSNDFVELYNPTDEPVSLDGWTVVRYSGNGNEQSDVAALNGTIQPGAHFLIQAASGNSDTGALPTPDYATDDNVLTIGASSAAIRVRDAEGNDVDLVGWGGNSVAEGSPAQSTSNSTSVQRTTPGVDTDDNAADFTVGSPSPTNAAGETSGGAADPELPVDPPEPGEVIPIAEIQGTGDATPLAGQTVTTTGVVTGVYAEGGRDGFYLQTPGTGGEEQTTGDASHGIFVHLGNSGSYPEIGESLTVTGQAGEHYGTTQLSDATVTAAAETFAPVDPVTIEHLPAGDQAREAYESMLVLPTGDYTVTNNYALNTYGEIGLAPGTEAFRQGTDVHAPDTDPSSPVQQLMAEQAAQEVTLDDGRTRNYMNTDTKTPLPYITADGEVHQSIRTGDTVDFQHPVVVHYDHDLWRFQPTTPITGHNSAEELPIAWEDSRAAEIGAIDTVEGDYSIASFNVLNYFTSLGQDEPGCEAYEDMHGTPVAADYCDVRGAYTEEALADQQDKIVAAINALDVDVLGLEEIENTATVTGEVERRDESLATLVDALNAAVGEERWAYVESPAQLGTDEDYIRVAFIYNPDTVEPVGESRIFDDQVYTGTARQPLAQEFAPVDGSGESFVAVVNHFKSKGSVTRGDEATGDGQGNNPNVRANQSQALLDHLGQQEDWEGKPTFILGDLNAYSRETAMTVLENAGYTNINTAFAGGEPTYQFGGRLGSLDHALGNEAAMELIQDARVWNINADEPVAFEYSRRNYNIVDFHDDSPFRSSDHDPIKVGFNLGEAGEPGQPEEPADPERPAGIAGLLINTEGELIITFTDGTEQNFGPLPGFVGQDGEDGRGIDTLEINDEGHLIVSYTDGTTQDLGRIAGADGLDGTDGTDGEDGRGIDTLEINDEGHLIATYSDGTTQDLGRVTATDGEDGEDGLDGTDGRGVDSFEINDEGHLIVSYTDGTTQDLGRVTATDDRDAQSGGSSSGFIGQLFADLGGLLGRIVDQFLSLFR
ncbi:ExeM/NucH family extracellular endonuclease [Corynebacterium halotolerans]|uniref:Extracellular nuclease n=1 Tax=Corynebacterium halotolerans YIM 70093 = DSM 44683 TaxID=1121362 RepID=M1NPR4_9CORY|nr:ExeM/NucH family extracellular endonuclease [Corynebacterium halotolerans]AGF73378.1 extracellular nuclease [Corynebacterium halotolerans YIM 70093 = DSM 44683]